MVGPENTWQNIGTLPGGENMGGSDVFMMCNINMTFLGAAVFISEDFRSGYAKNLFTVRAKKSDYVISKTLDRFVCGGLMLILYLLGVGMLFFMTVSMITPLGAAFLHALLCLGGGMLFAVGLGAVSNAVLKKTSLV
ncbi:MAG: hypothetical protein IJF67_01850 [Clostridia bacterium]|nr:hypothetical protein [Clostridia bacterium]